MSIDLKSLSYDQLMQLTRDAEALIKDGRKQKLVALRADIRKQIKDAGFTLDEVLAPLMHSADMKDATPEELAKQKPSSTRGTKVPAKYSDGENSWSGRGQTPKWLEAHLMTGKTVADFLINPKE
ncbi:H-NS histone family protein [Ralstonia sp. RRA.1]|uniref:H-NS histone family protein n=1 Tax=Ralstonia sp. RRA TaxID=3122075 RepID=UPI0030D1F4B3